MTDFGTMRRRIAAEIARDDLIPRISAAILTAIRFLEQERFWFNGLEATASTVASQANYAVPTDLLAPDTLTLTTGGVRSDLQKIPYGTLRARSDGTTVTGQPAFWSYYADQFWLLPTPGSIYTLTLSYHKRLAALSADTSTNAWMVEGEEVVRTKAKIDLLAQKGGQVAIDLREQYAAALAQLRRISSNKMHGAKLRVDEGLIASGGYDVMTG